MPDRAPPRLSLFARSITSWRVGIAYLPLWLWSRSAMACLARSVLISASVKSPANQSGRVDSVDLSRGLAPRELGPLGDVGGAAEHRLVAGDQHAVLGGDEVGLDEVGAHLDRLAVGFERVLGQDAARAAVADDEGRLPVERARPGRRGRAPRRGRTLRRGRALRPGRRRREERAQGSRRRQTRNHPSHAALPSAVHRSLSV
jgi:hypothetical protein